LPAFNRHTAFFALRGKGLARFGLDLFPFLSLFSRARLSATARLLADFSFLGGGPGRAGDTFFSPFSPSSGPGFKVDSPPPFPSFRGHTVLTDGPSEKLKTLIAPPFFSSLLAEFGPRGRGQGFFLFFPFFFSLPAGVSLALAVVPAFGLPLPFFFL